MKQKDVALVEYILANTRNGKLRWEPTASKNTFLVALRGNYTAQIEYHDQGHDELFLRNNAGEVILRLAGDDDSRINTIFELARRNAYNVDKAIDEILGGDEDNPSSGSTPISDEDIPF